VAAALGLTAAELATRIARAREILYGVRAQRVPPGLDDKVIAAWNGLAVSALAEAGRALGRADYVAAAVTGADFLVGSMRRGGRLCRTWKDGDPRGLGYLEDHATVGFALVDVYQATFDRRWIEASGALCEQALALFWDPAAEAFFDTGTDHERLVVRPRNLFHNAVPSGTAVAIDWLLRLHVLLGEERYEAIAVKALRAMADLMQRHPTGFGRYLSALDFHLGPVSEVALVWPDSASAEAMEPLLHACFARYLPNRVVAGKPESAVAAGIPLLADRTAVDGRPAAYVCRRYVCRLPTTDAADLARQLEGA
jgi:hypothetical protein